MELKATLAQVGHLAGTIKMGSPSTPYSGAYEVTPTKATQTLETAGKRAERDITVNPIPADYIIPAGDISITENGTVDVAQFARALVDVAGSGGGAETESGVWTPTADTYHGTIPLSQTHAKLPVLYAVWQADDTWPSSAQTNIGTLFIDVYQFNGVGYRYSQGERRYSLTKGIYLGSSVTGKLTSTTFWTLYSSDDPGSLSDQYTRFFATESELRPYGNSGRSWRAGTSYKWVALWL